MLKRKHHFIEKAFVSHIYTSVKYYVGVYIHMRYWVYIHYYIYTIQQTGCIHKKGHFVGAKKPIHRNNAKHSPMPRLYYAHSKYKKVYVVELRWYCCISFKSKLICCIYLYTPHMVILLLTSSSSLVSYHTILYPF